MKNIAEALSKAQAKITGAVADSANPFFKSKYADLSSVMAAIRVPFAENGLSYTQGARREVDTNGGFWVLTTTLLHASGETISYDYPIICAKQNDPQAFGAAVTYARRFSLSAMCGVAQIDDDAESTKQTAAVITPQVISEAQRRKLFVVCRENGWTETDLKTYINSIGVESTKDLQVKKYDEVCEYVTKNPHKAKADPAQVTQ